VSTGAMTGADAPSLRALAAQMSQSAGRLDGIRQGIRSRLYSIHWDGPDGANFRRAWDGQHVPMLAHVADGLRHAAVRLLAEADQQEAASGVGGGGGQTIGPATGRIDTHDGNGFLDDLEEGVDASAWVVGGFGALYTGILARYGNDVAGYFRNGTWVDGYHRWNPGRADGLNRWLGTAGDVNRSIGQLDRFGKVLTVAGAAFDGYGQWQED
jgi:hypothetical protein